MRPSYDNNQDLRIIKTKRIIVQTLWLLLREKPFEKITIKDICERGLINRSTFYLHFEDKDQLLMQCIYDEMYKIDQETCALIKDISILEYYTVLSNIVVTKLFASRDFLRSILKTIDLNILAEPIQSFLSFNIYRNIEQLKSTNKKFFTPTNVISEFFAGGVVSLTKWWVISDLTLSIEEMHGIVNNFVTSLISTFLQ